MADPREHWNEFDTIGEIEVRKRLAAHWWSEGKDAQANQWLLHRGSLDSANTLAMAREANTLARSANNAALEANAIARDSSSSASRSAEAARTSNIIAIAALIAAVIAIAVSIIGIFLHR